MVRKWTLFMKYLDNINPQQVYLVLILSSTKETIHFRFKYVYFFYFFYRASLIRRRTFLPHSPRTKWGVRFQKYKTIVSFQKIPSFRKRVFGRRSGHKHSCVNQKRALVNRISLWYAESSCEMWDVRGRASKGVQFRNKNGIPGLLNVFLNMKCTSLGRNVRLHVKSAFVCVYRIIITE